MQTWMGQNIRHTIEGTYSIVSGILHDVEKVEGESTIVMLKPGVV